MLGDSSVGDVVVVQVPLEAGAWIVGGDGASEEPNFGSFVLAFLFWAWVSIFFHSKLLDWEDRLLLSPSSK